MDSQDDRFEGNDAGYDSTAINLSHKGVVALAAIVFFSTVVLFILGMHIYACVVFNRRRRLAFVGEQDSPRLQRVGLARSAIEAIPVIVYQSENQRDMIECAVCLCEFEENEKARLLPKCQHSFHIDCIDMWLHSHSTCPLCRTSAQPDTPADSVVLLAADEEPASGSASETDRRMLHPPISEGSASTSMDTDHDIDLRPSCRQHEVLPSLKYPSNMHFWATQKRVSSVSNSTFYDQRATSSSCKTLDKIIIDIPQRDDSFSSPRRPFFSDDQQVFSPSGQSLKSPGMRLRSLKRLLSKGKKVLPQSPDGGRNIPIEQGIHHKTEDS